MISPARIAAYDILTAVSAGSADLPTAIAFARTGLRDDRDRALAAEIASGVQRWRAALDHLIVGFSKRSLSRLDPEIVEILRLSAYQLLHLTRVPASAVVDDAVNLAGRAGKRSAGGFVNAILRTISRRRDSLPLPPRPDDPADRAAVLDYFSITLSHPRWLATRWLDRLGFDAAEAWLQFNNAPGPVTLRANRLRLTPEELAARLAATGVTVHATRYAPDGLVVDEGYPLRGAGVDEGWFVVQDEASQLVPLLAGPTPAPHVLDTCASPAARQPHWPRRCRATACSSPATSATVASISAPDGGRIRAANVRSCRPIPRRRCRSTRCSPACSSTRHARPRHAAPRPRHPVAAARGRSGHVAAAELTMLQRAAERVAPGGR